MSEELERDNGANLEKAVAVLESSDQAMELEEARDNLMERWGSDIRFQTLLGDARGEQGEAYNRSALWAMAAAGGAFASIYGLPDNLMQYFDSVDQFQFAEFGSRVIEGAGALIAAVNSFQVFKDGLNMKPGIDRIIERWDSAEA